MSPAHGARPGFENRYAREVPRAGVAWQPARWPQTREVWFNTDLADELGLDGGWRDDATRAAWCAGQSLPPGAEPFAQAYAGHQFGGFSPQLGDGRALVLGEWVDAGGRRHDIALKGSGRTPYSRGGDGKAALGPMLRELIVGEAMHALGVPTTRALAVVATGEPVMRDRVLPGAVLTRVASSHLRVGTFEFFAARDDRDGLIRLTDHAIARHDPELVGRPDRVIAFLRSVVSRQARLVAQWMSLGFIHGVMNTDNMTISGQTIDYGPCAFMEAFDPATVYSSIDHQGRYAWGRQPAMAQWNLARLAEALLPLIDADEDRALEMATEAINGFAAAYAQDLLSLQRRKLGLGAGMAADDETDRQLVSDWLGLMQAAGADHTRAWRALAWAAVGEEQALRQVFGLTGCQPAPVGSDLDGWLARWRSRLSIPPAAPRSGVEPSDAAVAAAGAIRRCNPTVIPRNHLVEQALEAAVDRQDLAPLESLMRAVARPFDEDQWDTEHAQPAPADVAAAYRTFCGT